MKFRAHHALIFALLLSCIELATANDIVIEAKVISIEFYETSKQYALVHSRCSSCPNETVRISPNARVLFNRKNSKMSDVYNHRFKLKPAVTFNMQQGSNLVTWLSLYEEK